MNRFVTPSDRWRLSLLGCCCVLLLIIQPMTAIVINSATFLRPFLIIAAVAATGLIYRGLGRDESVGATCFVLAQMLLFSNCIALLNYLGLALHRPLHDEFLARADDMLGLDWWGYVTWLKSNPYIAGATTLAYNSSLFQLVAAILALGFTRRFERLDRFSLAFMIAATITVGAWCLFPNLGALPLHYAQGLPEPSFSLAMTKKDALELMALVAGAVPPVQFEELTGLIGCPSFHTVLALLTLYAFWPIPWLGLLAAAVSVPVFLSIPADGGHHFVDMAAGLVVTAVSLGLASLAPSHRLEPRIVAQEAFA